MYSKILNRVLVVMSLSLLLVNIVLLYKFYQSNQLNRDLDFTLKLKSKSCDEVLDNYLRTVFMDSDISLKNELQLINGVNNQNKKCLVLYFEEINCSVCINKQLQVLKEYEEKFGSENIVLIANFSNIRYANAFIRVNDVKYNFYYAKNPLAPEFINQPAFFVMDEDYNIDHIFVTDKNNQQYTERYLSKIVDLNILN